MSTTARLFFVVACLSGRLGSSLVAAEQEFRLAVVLAGQSPAPEGDTHASLELNPGENPFNLDVLMTTANLPSDDGVQGWSLSIFAEPCFEVRQVTLKGVIVSTIYDESRPPGIIHHENYPQELSDPGVFSKIAGLGFNVGKGDPLPALPQGGISAVVLRAQERMVLTPNITQQVLRIAGRIQADPGESGSCRIAFQNGLRLAVSGAVNNVITFQGGSRAPTAAQALVIEYSTLDYQPVFIRGDATGDRKTNIADAIRIVLAVVPALNPGGTYDIPCRFSGDVDGNGRLELVDAIDLIGYLFRSGTSPPAPFPGCGKDGFSSEEACPPGSTGCPPAG